MASKQPVGMIVYAFAWRRDGDSPCNIKLARAAKRIACAHDGPVIIHAQRSVAKILREMGVRCDGTEKRPGYEGSEEPTNQAAELFQSEGITEVIPVANPFLHLLKCVQLVHKKGFKTPPYWDLDNMIGWIGFDQLSEQPGTRGPVELAYYTFKQMVLGYRPPVEQSEP